MKFVMLGLAGVLLASSAALAQPQPYAGLQSRPIKALSEQQIADLRAGRGIGMALAAELNGYPGPMHVLELGDKLGLTAAQREQVQALFAAMKAEAIPLGEQLIAREQELDRLFAERAVTPASLTTVTQSIGSAQATLRETHLKYHLSTLALLSADQVQRYTALRGYSGAHQHQHQHRRH